jgi:predicted KAP-like P-loop ATPase
MWADKESRLDYLNFSDIAEAAVDVICNPTMRPVSIGVFGDWGAGKSSLLQQIEAQLGESETKTLVVTFDAWLYQGYDDARAALLEVIADKLDEAANDDESLLQKTGSLLGRVNILRAIGVIGEGAAALSGIPTGGLIAKGLAYADKMLGSGDSNQDLDSETLAEGKELAATATEKCSGLIRPKKPSTPPREIAAFRKLYGEILAELGITLVVFIDNLDRCLPKNCIQTLEAIRLFLFLPNTAFVIAADEDMIRDAVADQYEGLSERHRIDYLDKLIQVPLHVPKASVADVRAYIYLLYAEMHKVDPNDLENLRKALIDSLRQSWCKLPLEAKGAVEALGGSKTDAITTSFNLADRISPLLAQSSMVRGNPRIIKRLLNTVQQRSAIARRRSIDADAGLITKMAVFERCAGPLQAVDLYRLIDESAGKPELFTQLENFTGDGLPVGAPESWIKSPTTAKVIRDWAQLSPSLQGVDLRALVYLSRETLPLGMQIHGLSTAAREALSVLSKVANMSSPAATNAASSLSTEDAVLVQEALIGELRKVTDWSSKPIGLIGALLLADRHPSAAALLVRYFEGMKRNEPWFKALTKNSTWLKGR